MSETKLQHKRTKIISSALILTVIAVALIVLLWYVPYTNHIELTQLTNTTPRQMMGYIIHTKNNKNIVIDGGFKEDSQNVMQYIQKHGGKVDTWFITHPHEDHVGAIQEIINDTDISIDNIYVSLNTTEWYETYGGERAGEAKEFIQTIQQDKVKDKVQEVTIGQDIQIDNIKFKILGIKNPEITQNAMNNSSMVIKCQINQKSILFLGDTGVESGRKLLQQQKENLKADYVQIAHHGQAGAEVEVYQAIQPKVALWPTPDWLWHNDKGEGEDSGTWKTKETRKWLGDLGVKTNIIEKDGIVTIKIY